MSRVSPTRSLFACLTIGVLVAAAFMPPVFADPETVTTAAPEPAATDPADDPTERAESSPDVLSTELSGVDSLGITSDTLITSFQGGTRRVHLERTVFRRETPVEYVSNGRRDPFRALVIDERKEGEIETDLLRMEKAVLTGVVWSDGEYVAMVRDKDGNNFLLHEGDPVFNGRMTAVTQSQAVFDLVEFGDYQQIVLKVASAEKLKDKAQS
ncbi:hypothetical protein HZB60_06480 [candidate division KSB1 bacterium]|nr:hypothetical protein [candidate division KSB1 bacterium]